MTTDTLPKRHAKVLADLRKITKAHAMSPAPEWLRRAATLRRDQAEIYRQAASDHDVDSIVWHGLQEAALLLDHHAAVHELHAQRADTASASEEARA